MPDPSRRCRENGRDGSVCVSPRRRSRNRAAQSGLARPISHHPHPPTPTLTPTLPPGTEPARRRPARLPPDPATHPIRGWNWPVDGYGMPVCQTLRPCEPAGLEPKRPAGVWLPLLALVHGEEGMYARMCASGCWASTAEGSQRRLAVEFMRARRQPDRKIRDLQCFFPWAFGSCAFGATWDGNVSRQAGSGRPGRCGSGPGSLNSLRKSGNGRLSALHPYLYVDRWTIRSCVAAVVVAATLHAR